MFKVFYFKDDIRHKHSSKKTIVDIKAETHDKR